MDPLQHGLNKRGRDHPISLWHIVDVTKYTRSILWEGDFKCRKFETYRSSITAWRYFENLALHFLAFQQTFKFCSEVSWPVTVVIEDQGLCIGWIFVLWRTNSFSVRIFLDQLRTNCFFAFFLFFLLNFCPRVTGNKKMRQFGVAHYM